MSGSSLSDWEKTVSERVDANEAHRHIGFLSRHWQAMIPYNSNKPILVSDYCPGIPRATLEFNDGLPVQGN
jgi:hypothetical protein